MRCLQVKRDFIALLREHTDIDRHSRWGDVKKRLDTDPRYKAVESSSAREDWFREHVKALKEERKREKERDREKRDKRENKDKGDKERDREREREKEKEKEKEKEEENDATEVREGLVSGGFFFFFYIEISIARPCYRCALFVDANSKFK